MKGIVNYPVQPGDSATVRYNETTDRFEVLYNGSWVQSIRAFVKSIPVWVAGLFGITVENGVYSYSSSYPAQGFVVNGTELVATMTSQAGATLVGSDLIDFSSYSKIKVKYRRGSNPQTTLELNISGFSQSGYIEVTYTRSSGNYCVLDVGVLSAKQNNYSDSRLIRTYQDWQGNATLYIDEITIE